MGRLNINTGNIISVKLACMFDISAKRSGRGAQSNRTGRFEPLQRIDIDDGWGPA